MSPAADEITRVKRPKDAAKAVYDRMSRWYDWLTLGSEKRFTDLGLLKLGAKPGEKILEIGFGTGRALVELAKGVGDSGKVHGIDISEGMLKIAAQRLRSKGLADRVELSNGDAVRLSHPDDFFDGIFMSFVLELFDTPEIPLVLGECHRTLKRNGRLCVVALSKKDLPAVRVYEWFHIRFPTYIDCRPIYAGQAVEQAGFGVFTLTRARMWGLPVEIVLAQKK